ncbi:endonuclease/exonuclease/phosphatase family protein [Microbacterium sp. YY-01]|uniref:endonuclease/exonuclease/phosphatase family protein n=1 Tax=Microbacterium sp. YY-01 TaxID=3421634 RepID=UPI003D16D2EF
MFRLLGVLISVLFAIGTAVVTWPAFFRVEQVFPFTQLVASRGLLVVVFAVVAIFFLLLSAAKPVRGFAASVVIIALIGAGASAFIMVNRGLGADELPDKVEGSVRVLAWNTAGEAVSADTIAQVIVDEEVDIVALPETIAEVGEEIAVMLREQGHPMWVHHVQFNPDIDNGPQSWQTTLLISPDLGDYSVIESSSDGSSNTLSVPSAVAMPVDGNGPTVVAVHTVAPRMAEMTQWQHDLAWVADQCPAETSVILAGDFNATLDHMRGLGIAGADLGYCTDAAARTGNGSVGTWHTDFPALLGAPIDHVMTSSHWEPVGSVVIDPAASHSDHRGIVVQLNPHTD